jgi:outer membrane protein TolC
MKAPQSTRRWWQPLGCGMLIAAWAGVGGGCARYKPMPLDAAAVKSALTVPADDLMHSPASAAAGRAAAAAAGALPDVAIDLRDGLSPDEAAVVAVTYNPTLRAERNRVAVSSAQLFQAGILPNPQLTLEVDPVIGGNTAGTTTGWAVNLSWEVTALITHDAKVAAARSGQSAVRLDVAWKEWQAAAAARLAVFDLVALNEQLTQARAVLDRLTENLRVMRQAVDQGQKTVVDLAAAETATDDARAAVLALEQETQHQRATLARAIGLPPDKQLPVQRGVHLPSRLDVPDASTFDDSLEERRLDLVGLHRGYESQESTLRAAVLAQFPKVSLGVFPASDTTNVHTFGIGATIDLPVFDRNQGNIAIERATRRQLFDEYIDRVFAARSDVAIAVGDIRALGGQIAAANEAIPRAERLVDAYKKALDAGNADVLSYYAALNDLAQKRIGMVKLKQQLVQAGAALELATGQFLPALSAAGNPAPTTKVAHAEARR